MAVTSIDTDFFIRRPVDATVRAAASRERFAVASAERDQARAAERRPDPSARSRTSATVERDRPLPEQRAARAERLGIGRDGMDDRRAGPQASTSERPRATGPDEASRNAPASERDRTAPRREGPDGSTNADGTPEAAAAADASVAEENGEAAEENVDENSDEPTAQPTLILSGLAIPPVAARREGGEPGSQDGEEPGAAQGPRTAGSTTSLADQAAAGTGTPAEIGAPGFEALLASAATTAPETPTSSAAGSTAVAATASASPTGAAGEPSAQAPPPPTPLGAVPMTIGLRSLGGSSRFEIRLDPVDLGRIDVSLDIDKDRGTVTTHLVVERPETLALLQRDAGSLQQALSQAGLDPSEGGINLSLRGENGSGGQGSDAERSDRRRHGSPTEPNDARTQTEAVPLRSLRGLSGLDIRI
ncbi:MAG TPA: flagellar hook-length control protein FliK [Methylobacterium sp.]